MKKLLESYKKSKSQIKARLKDFENNKDYFYELCFCLLTPQSSAKRADVCIQELKQLDFKNKDINPVKILEKKIRFHNNKSNYLNEAKNNYKEIEKALNNIKDSKELREFLVKNIKGYGYKEASHFLRNIGFKDYAIIDFHIVDILANYGLIEKPKTLTPKKYLEIENVLRKLAQKTNTSLGELDLYLWYNETGKVLK